MAYNIDDINNGLNVRGQSTDRTKKDLDEYDNRIDIGNIFGTAAGGIGAIIPDQQETEAEQAIYGSGDEDNWLRFYNVVSGNSVDNFNKKLAGKNFDLSNVDNMHNATNAYDINMLENTANIDSPLSFSGWIDNAKAGLQGMKKGSIGGIFGALGGLASEGTLNWITRLVGYGNEDEINNSIKRHNKNIVSGYYNQLDNINQRQQRQNMMNYFAEGGSLDEQNGITKFNVGSTHENNPLGGIQQGVASDGLPNQVEEGEIKYKDYIYSARLKPSKSLLKDYNLPEKYAGKTFAEVADVLQKESKDRPNDPISLKTLDEWMNRLAGAQEEYKAKAEERRLAKIVNNMSDEEKASMLASLVQPMMQQQQGYDLSQPMYAEGGSIHIAPSKRGTFTAAAKKHGKSVQAFASQVLANKENYSPAMVKKANFARNVAKWHSDGGHLFAGGGPRGTYNDYLSRLADIYGDKYDWMSKENFDKFSLAELRNLDYNNKIEALLNSLRTPISRELPVNNETPIVPEVTPEPVITTENTEPVTNSYFYNTPGVSGLLSGDLVNIGNYGKAKYFSNIVDENGNYRPGYVDWVNSLTEEDFKHLYSLMDKNTKKLNPDLKTFKERALDVHYKDGKEAETKLDRLQNTHSFINSLYRRAAPANSNSVTRWWTYDDATGERTRINPTDIDLSQWEYNEALDEYGPENDGNYYNDYFLVRKPGVDNSTNNNSKTKTTPKADVDNRGEALRYAPVVGSGLGALTSMLQPVDYTLANELRGLAPQFKPMGAPYIGGYRRYTPYDINLGDAENLAMEARTIDANRGQNRATQGALNIAAINAFQKANALRNLEWQKANEANRLATDQYNLGIDQYNTGLTQAYDQLNAGINAQRIGMLANAAQAADASRTAWANNVSTNTTNFFNNLGDLGRDEWARLQLNRLLSEYNLS